MSMTTDWSQFFRKSVAALSMHFGCTNLFWTQFSSFWTQCRSHHFVATDSLDCMFVACYSSIVHITFRVSFRSFCVPVCERESALKPYESRTAANRFVVTALLIHFKNYYMHKPSAPVYGTSGRVRNRVMRALDQFSAEVDFVHFVVEFSSICVLHVIRCRIWVSGWFERRQCVFFLNFKTTFCAKSVRLQQYFGYLFSGLRSKASGRDTLNCLIRRAVSAWAEWTRL